MAPDDKVRRPTMLERRSRVSTSSSASCRSRRRRTTDPRQLRQVHEAGRRNARQFAAYAFEGTLCIAMRGTVAGEDERGQRHHPDEPRSTGIKSLDRLRRRRHGGHALVKDGKTNGLLRRWCSSRTASGSPVSRRRRAPSTAKSSNPSPSRRTCSATLNVLASARLPAGDLVCRRRAWQDAPHPTAHRRIQGDPMRAAILTAFNEDMVVEDVTPLDPGPSDVVVRIAASGVCHSDLPVDQRHVPMPAAVHPRPRGRGHRRGEVGSEVRRVAGGRPRDRLVHPRVRQLLLLPARPVAPVRR